MTGERSCIQLRAHCTHTFMLVEWLAVVPSKHKGALRALVNLPRR